MSTQALNQAILEKLSFVNFPRISLHKIWIFGFILITSLLIIYIFQISEITKASFSASQYEEAIAKLAQQNKSLELSLSQDNSLVSLESMLRQLNYEKVDKVYYIKVIDKGVAAKR